MTTGTTGTVTGLNYDWKSWTGGDGKYDPNGQLQWNIYKMDRKLVTHLPNDFGFYAPCRSEPPPFDSNLEIKSLNKVVEKVKNHSFNLAVATAESRQTLRLIKDNLLSVGRAALDVKNGRFSVAVERLLNSPAVNRRLTPSHRGSIVRIGQITRREAQVTDVFQKWLELQYGWLPLLSDVHEASKFLESRVKRKQFFDVTKTSVNSKGRWDSSESPPNYSNIGQIFEVCKITSRSVITDETIPSELGLEDPLTVAWEVLPFSFVADWFIPIGAYLTAVNQVPRVLNKILITRFQRGEAKNVVINNPALGSGYFSSQLYVRMDRRVGTGATYSVPTPQFKSLEKAMSPLHIVNGIALLTVLLSSDKSRQSFNPVGF